MAFLATHPGKVFTRGQIQECIWGEGEVDAHSNSITVFVRKIREKIEENPSEPTKAGVSASERNQSYLCDGGCGPRYAK